MNKSNYLFDMVKLVKRPIPEQRAYELEYYEFLTSLPSKVDMAFSMTREEMKPKMPLSVNRNWFANTMNGNFLALIAKSNPEYVKSTGRGSYCLLMNFKYECYVKKLTSRKLFPQYNHSRTSKALTDQEAKPSEEILPIVYIGYTINKSNDKITGYYAVCIKGDERIWSSDLTSIEPPQIKEASNDQAIPTIPVVRVRVKENKKAK